MEELCDWTDVCHAEQAKHVVYYGTTSQRSDRSDGRSRPRESAFPSGAAHQRGGGHWAIDDTQLLRVPSFDPHGTILDTSGCSSHWTTSATPPLS